MGLRYGVRGMSLFTKKEREQLHAKLDEMSKAPMRKLVDDGNGGLREETDAEFRARLKAMYAEKKDG